MELLSTICIQTLQSQREHARRLKQQWRDGEPADARAAIDEIGGSIIHKSIAIELAYEEFCQRKAGGEDVRPSDFAERFPTVQHSLRRQIGIHQFLSQRGMTEAEPLPDWPEAGDEVAGFLLKEELGRGAFGRVFLAHELKLRERTVVVKVARQGLREAQLLAQVSHPGIVPIYSAETDADWGLTTICMPFNSRATLLDVLEFTGTLDSAALDGQTIPQAVANRNCSDDQLTLLPQGTESVNSDSYVQSVIYFARLLTDSLSFAHQKGVQHRDLKPSNILVNSVGHPLLIDFNLSTEPTSEDFIGGTLPYMSPEQLMAVLSTAPNRGFELPEIDRRSDLYSLSVCLYQLWNGYHPLGKIPAELNQMELADYLLERQALGPIAGRLSTNAREAALQELIRCCLSYYADERPESADALLDALDDVEQTNVTVETLPSVWSRPSVAIFASLLIAAAAPMIWMGLQPPPVVTVVRDFRKEARVLLSRGEFDEAVDVLNEAIRIDGESELLLTFRGRANLELARYAEAFDDYGKVYQISSSASSATFAAYAAASQGKYQTAVDWYEIAVAENPDSLSTRNNLGYAFLKLASYREAIAQLDAAVQIDPDHVAPRISRAIANYRLARTTGNPLDADIIQDLDTFNPGAYGWCFDTHLEMARACAMCEPLHKNTRTYLRWAWQSSKTDADTIRQDPAFEHIRNEPFFEEVLTSKRYRSIPVDEVRLIQPW